MDLLDHRELLALEDLLEDKVTSDPLAPMDKLVALDSQDNKVHEEVPDPRVKMECKVHLVDQVHEELKGWLDHEVL